MDLISKPGGSGGGTSNTNTKMSQQAAATTTTTTASAAAAAGARRTKKRPSYGIRTVELTRGQLGFGFTLSGQGPCILSNIVAESPAGSFCQEHFDDPRTQSFDNLMNLLFDLFII